MKRPRAHLRLLWLALCIGCADSRVDKNATSPTTAGDGFTGSAVFSVAPGNGVAEGLAPGAGPGAIADGWTVSYDKFLVTIGQLTADDLAFGVGDGAVHIVDLLTLPDASYTFARLERVPTGPYPTAGFRLAKADDAAELGRPEWSADRDLMIKGGYSLFVSGTITSDTGQSCRPTDPTDCVPTPSIAFEIALDSSILLSDCQAIAGEAFSVDMDQTTEVTVSIHGDRWFRTDFTGAAGELRAQWIADADLDRDGTLVTDELRKIDAVDLFGAAYDLSTDAPAQIQTAYDFVLVQALASVGFRGDGSCLSRIE